MAEDWYSGMDGEFSRRLKAMIEASGGRMSVGSGFRSVAEQTELWNGAVAKYGSEDAARQWVAPPGSSNHNHGVAADIGFDGDGQDWAHANAARFGLNFPMSWEPWHIEPVGVRDGTYRSDVQVDTGTAPGSGDAYTTAPSGERSPVDATQRFDLAYQLNMLNGILMGPSAGEVSNPNADIQTGAQPKPVGSV